MYRWVGTGVCLFLFFLRILIAQGWYIGASRTMRACNPAYRDIIMLTPE